MKLERDWDVVVVGGGITGAGIFRQAVHQGHKTLLVEQKDFAWGTSSRSSKLVHGGLRYLKEGKVGLVRDSVRERQNLMEELPGLVNSLSFLVPDYKGQFPPSVLLKTALAMYDALGKQWQHQWFDRDEFLLRAPHLRREGLNGGARFADAQVDDARLVLRTLLEGEAEGGVILNYTKAGEPRREGERTVLTLQDGEQSTEVSARVVFNATGAWADRLQQNSPHRIRPLRGCHITFSAWRLPLPCAYSFSHPVDRRPMFLIPWEGAVFCGTTDLDHDHDLNLEPRISEAELHYLLHGINFAVPHLHLELEDLTGSWAGVRPVLSGGKDVDPSQETRDHAVWVKDGVVSMTGGKLTTFRLMAQEALAAAAGFLRLPARHDLFRFQPAEVQDPRIQRAELRRLSGRYGARAQELLSATKEADLETIPGTLIKWCELRWAARHEKVRHLDDLLLRRTRWGFVLPQGGSQYLGRLETVAREELGWTRERWEAEVASYLELWRAAYSVEGVLKV